MNIIESLKEVGEIKLTRLSDRKVRLEFIVNITCNDKIVDKLNLKLKYLLDKRDNTYIMAFPKNSFLVRLSNTYRVKMKYIHYKILFHHKYMFSRLEPGETFELYDLKFNNLITSIQISDEDWFKEWNRDKQIKEILK